MASVSVNTIMYFMRQHKPKKKRIGHSMETLRGQPKAGISRQIITFTKYIIENVVEIYLERTRLNNLKIEKKCNLGRKYNNVLV